MKIIFLDIDGVLNNIKTDLDEDIEDELLQRLLDLIYYTNAKIVLSSSWRCNSNALKKLYSHPLINNDFIYEVLPAEPEDKGQVIKEYLQSHTNVDNYVIIDDENNELYDKRHFVKTTFQKGFDDNALQQSLKILEEELL